MTTSTRTAYLLNAFFNDAITPEEKLELADLVESTDEEQLSALLEDAWRQNTSLPGVFSPEESLTILANILEQHPADKAPRARRRRLQWVIAAAIMMLVIAGSVVYNFQPQRDSQVPEQTSPDPVPDLPPGGNKAVLVLADGSVIELDTVPKGTIGQQGQAIIRKLDDGRLAYSTEKTLENILFNTVRTPRGGQYQLTLADGTRVWLNAASSIRFPTAFSGKVRQVSISGEVFFDVQPMESKPFIVDAGRGVQIAVTGTQFNVNAYEDEGSLHTTLLEGSIRVNTPNGEALLSRPNEQAQWNETLSVVTLTDSDVVTAWMQGWFLFDKSSLPDIMRQISRWYDVDIRMSGKTSKRSFSGIVNRDNNINEVLKVMESAGIRFTMIQDTLIVLQ